MQQKDYMSAILDVQPKSKEYSALQSRMHLLEGIYQDDCYEVPQAEVRKIAINMERLRWMDIDADSYIQINIPSFTLQFRQPDTTYEFKILAGKPATPTPILKSAITYFSTGPNRKPVRSMTVIKLPVAKENEYQGNNAVNSYDKPTSAAGTIYFWLADNSGINLQGLANAQITKKMQGASTDGVIKVENGKKLAALLLKRDNAAARINEMQAAFAAAQLKNFMLNKPVPVKVTYVTCEMKDGVLVSYPDVYNKDKKLEMALYNTTQTLTMR
jgi:murein L,D-transpeptidase YcbB/YkuD